MVCVYSPFSMRSGYHHIMLSRESQPKSAFVSPMGKFELICVPFGLAPARAYFQTLVNDVLTRIDFDFTYLDDILVFSPDIKTHLKHLRILFQRLREADLNLKESKCYFLKAYPLFRSSNFGQRHWTITTEIRMYWGNALTQKSKIHQTFPKTSTLLLQVYTTFCRYS